MKQLLQNEIPSYKEIFSFANLFSAWREFQNEKRKKKDVMEFAENIIHNLSVLENDLLSGSYLHGGYFYFKIADPKPRDIHKALVRDRVVHRAIYRALYPYFDNKFIYDSYSCRLKKGTHKSINRFRDFSRIVGKNNTKTCWVLKCDIRKFFASIDHDILKRILAKYITDKDTLWLLSQVIDSFLTKDATNSAMAEFVASGEKGLPLGNLTSQLLVNIYMNEFDQYVKRELKVKYYIRYADDFVIFSGDKKYLKNTMDQMKNFLGKDLKLNMHPDKVFIKAINSGLDFLGWVNFSKHRVLRTATKKRMFRKLKENNYKKESLNSYLGMLSHGNGYKLELKIH